MNVISYKEQGDKLIVVDETGREHWFGKYQFSNLEEIKNYLDKWVTVKAELDMELNP